MENVEYTVLMPKSIIDLGFEICELQDITMYELVCTGITLAITEELKSLIKDGEEARLRAKNLYLVREKQLSKVLDYLNTIDGMLNDPVEEFLKKHSAECEKED